MNVFLIIFLKLFLVGQSVSFEDFTAIMLKREAQNDPNIAAREAFLLFDIQDRGFFDAKDLKVISDDSDEPLPAEMIEDMLRVLGKKNQIDEEAFLK